jgi:hypothetical protein
MHRLAGWRKSAEIATQTIPGLQPRAGGYFTTLPPARSSFTNLSRAGILTCGNVV